MGFEGSKSGSVPSDTQTDRAWTWSFAISGVDDCLEGAPRSIGEYARLRPPLRRNMKVATARTLIERYDADETSDEAISQ